MNQLWQQCVGGIVAVLGLTAAVDGAFINGLVNVDFNGNTQITATGPAVVGANGDIWNAFRGGSATNAALLKADGTASDAFFTYTARGSYGMPAVDAATAVPVNPDLLGDYLHIGSDPGAATFSGLSPAHTYDLYVYSAVGTVVTGFEVIGATTLTGNVTPGDPPTSYVLGENYRHFSLNPDASGKIQINFTRLVGGEGHLNALQLAVVPEPASASLLLLGGLPLLARRRNDR